MKRRRNIHSIFLSIILPSILVELIFYKFDWIFYRWPGSRAILIEGAVLYGITIIGLVLFYKLRMCSMWVLPLGFALPVLLCYVNDTLNDSEWLTYLGTTLIAMYYSIPLVLVTVVIALICTIRNNKRKWRVAIKQKGLTLQEVKEWCIRKKQSLLSTAILTAVFLSIAVICAVHISRLHMVRRDIIQKIDLLMEQEEECVFKLSDVTRFKWDKVAYFKHPISEEEISRALGVNYTGGTDVMEGFIFAYGGRVVHKDIVGIALGSNHVHLGVEVDSLIVLSESDAVFEGRKIHDNFYLIKPVSY